jgi:hypothetical protein
LDRRAVSCAGNQAGGGATSAWELRMTALTTDCGLTLLTVAKILADDPHATFLGADAAVLPELPDAARELSLRESYLDQFCATLEADPSPKKPVHIDGGPRIAFRQDNLKKRKKRTPSERERRRLLGLQLADFLTAGGL